MPALTLVLEGHAKRQFASAADVERAVRMMPAPGGPTYIILKDPYGSYAHAAGFDDRFRVEVRDVYGEGFQHWLAGVPNVKDRSDVVMYYRNHCDVHGIRQCPLLAWGENVLALSDVLAIMRHYHASGERLAIYPWEDVSKYFIDEGLAGDGGRIRRIRPHDEEHGEDL
jgi:hypothetical protein